MAEQVSSVLVEKFNDNYDRSKFVKNFVAEGELTVTITLEEYRELISFNATAKDEITKANEARWEKNSECDALKKEIESLKQRIVDLTTLECRIENTKEGED